MFVYREEYYLDKAEPVQKENENRETIQRDLDVGKKEMNRHMEKQK